MKYILGLVLMLASTLSSAGILIEPQLGYVFSHSLKTTASLSANGATSSLSVNASGTALEYGGRLGYSFLGLSTGLNYSNGANSKGSNLGVFVGYSAPILIRAWAAYNFDAKVNYNSTIKTEGSSIEAGLGFTGFPFLSLNLIFRTYDLTTFKYSSTTYTTSLSPTELEFAISLPFNL
jgi:hypothetical protein